MIYVKLDEVHLINDLHTSMPQPSGVDALEDTGGAAVRAGANLERDAVAFILSPAAQPILAELAHEPLDDQHALALVTRLRRSFPTDIAAALVTQARLRRRGMAKFADAGRMFFTAEALEQATGQIPAAHRAAQLDQLAPPGAMLDLGCGIGGDLIELARRRAVIAYELDAERARFAAANLAALGLSDHVTIHTTDWTAQLDAGTLPQAAAAVVDPARRSAGRRTFSLHAMQPPLSDILKLRTHVELVAVKVMPGVRDEELPPGCCVEFVSHEGTCKEAVLWFGRDGAPQRWASVHCGDGWHTLADDGQPPPRGELTAGMILYEPDPAVIRARALAPLCARVRGHLFEPDIAYIVAAEFSQEPLAQAFAIDEVAPFSLKGLNERLAASSIGRVELLKRGFPQEPESLRPRLQLVPGGRAAVVILTRRGRDHWMLIGRRLSGFGEPAGAGDSQDMGDEP